MPDSRSLDMWEKNEFLHISKHPFDVERGFGFTKYQYTTCHPHAHSPRPEVLQEVPVQLLSYEHRSTHSGMERLVVTPLKETV